MNSLDSVNEDESSTRSELMYEMFFSKMNASQLGPGPFPGWATSSRLYFDVPFTVVVDEDLLPKHPLDLIRSADFRQQPELLTGVNQDEGIYFVLYGLAMNDTKFLHDDGTITIPDPIKKAGAREPLIPGGPLADFHWITALQFLSKQDLLPGVSNLPAVFYDLPMNISLIKTYGNPDESKLTELEVIQRLSDLASDLDFVCPTLALADVIARQPNATVFLYLFTQTSSKLPWPSWVGVMHGYEIPFVFGMPRSVEFTTAFYDFTEDEKEFSDKMQDYWVNFAKTG